MERIRCNLCNGAVSFPFVKAQDPARIEYTIFTAVKCTNCGLIYTNPQPSQVELDKFYPENYYRKPGIFIRSIINLFQIVRKRRIESKKKGGKVLDIGYGDASFLECMSDRNWEVYGIERTKMDKPSPSIHIFERNLTGLPGSYFDIVTMWHVFEHVEDPTKLLQEVARILKADGLLIIMVPNIESLQFKMFKSNWFPLDMPRHLYHYSAETLKKMVKKSSLIPYEINNYSIDSFAYSLFGSFQSLLNAIGGEFNFLYNFLRNRKKKIANLRALYSGLLLLLGIFFLPLLIGLHIILFRDGVIELWAQNG